MTEASNPDELRQREATSSSRLPAARSLARERVMPLALAQLQDLGDRLSDRLRPWSRSAQFWVRAVDIYTSYKVCQLRAGFAKDEEEREAMWEQQHELGAQKMYSLCSELGGFFLKAAQILGKPDLAPTAWVKRLVTLCDKAPTTPIDVVRDVVEKQFGKSFDEIFGFFDVEPVGSASIAQVHRARLKLSNTDVAVKVQHPGAEKLMMVDIQNMQAFALFLQKHDINFDLFSTTKEMEKQICYEFDFVREAKAMERIREFLRLTNKKPPVIVPRVIPGMVSSASSSCRVIVIVIIHHLDCEDMLALRLVAACKPLIAMETLPLLPALFNFLQRETHGVGWRLVDRS